AQTDAVTDLATRLNRERIARGLAPLALNPKLTAAAQGHADDIARNRNFGHIGSDGSTATERIARAGYGKYSWGYRVGENWAHFRNVADAVAMWMDSAPHRNNILHPVLREMGIGIATVPSGHTIYVVNFGAQPNVLPIFINDGATETTSPEVQLTLTSEEVTPNGDGDAIGRPVQVQIANTSDFAGAVWQSFATKIHWTLASSNGVQTVYVKYRDAKGRTAIASASILVRTTNVTATRVLATATSTRVATRSTLLPTLAPTVLPTDTPTPTATFTPTATPEPTMLPTETPMPTPTLAEGRSQETRMDGLGILAVTLVSLVLIRTWYSAGR
ncbi:MAG: CAP domain-containing protein, partial [Anaerolineae bacterium]|nr:CAP domain-containing protein [Anaerolineae bacterium]